MNSRPAKSTMSAPERLVAAFAPRLYRYALVRLKRADRAEDAVGEVLCRLVEKGPSLDGPTAHIHGWCVRCMVNVCREIERGHVDQRFESSREKLSFRFEDWCDRSDEGRRALIDAMAHLSPRQQEAIILRVLMGLPVSAVACAMSCAEGTVKALTHQGLATLRRNTDARRAGFLLQATQRATA